MEDKKNQPGGNNADKQSASENIRNAHEQADKDIENDAELSAHSPNDELDEGETARLGEGENPLI